MNTVLQQLKCRFIYANVIYACTKNQLTVNIIGICKKMQVYFMHCTNKLQYKFTIYNTLKL